MKVGLVRHFKVKHEYPKGFLIGVSQLSEWLNGYDIADIHYNHETLPHTNWAKCYTSTALRATKTAEKLYPGELIGTDVLRELNVLPLFKTKIKLPLLLWGIIVRNKSLASNRITDPFKVNIRAFLDEALSQKEEDVLIVSHGFVMMHIQRELFERGFKGSSFGTPANGRLYVYEK